MYVYVAWKKHNRTEKRVLWEVPEVFLNTTIDVNYIYKPATLEFGISEHANNDYVYIDISNLIIEYSE